MTGKQDHIQALLKRIDADPKVIDAVMRLDAVMQHWRRKMTKRELGRRAIEKLNLPVEQGQLDVLFAIAAPIYTTDAGSETMVATVAERLGIDPSRASRIVSDLVSTGYARRAVSQVDARRTIVELTEKGMAITEAVQSYKWLMMADYFSGWSREDIAAFVPLLERYTTWFNDVAVSEARLVGEISAIAESVHEATGSGEASGRQTG
jgi:DNA-binding MarR family transcriptional regulator